MAGGSVAHKLETPQRERLRVVKTRKKVRSVRARLMLWLLVSFAVALAMIWRYAGISDKNAEINALNKQIAEIQAENEWMELEIEQSIRLKTLEEYAINELGMVKPGRNQFVYITPSGKDVMQKVGSK